jgi:capsular polysaccharide biosynthesis protein
VGTIYTITNRMSTHPSTHFDILSRAKWFILLFTLLAGVAAFTWALIQPTSYKAVVAFDVRITNRAETQDYQYGAYYDLKGAEVFTQHVMSWFKTPAFVEDIYKNANVGYTIQSINRFTSRFDVKQYSAQNFVVLFSDYNKDTAQKLGDSVAKTVEERAAGQITTNDQTQFVVDAQAPVVVASQMNAWLALAIGLVVGVGLSIILVYIREYMRE